MKLCFLYYFFKKTLWTLWAIKKVKSEFVNSYLSLFDFEVFSACTVAVGNIIIRCYVMLQSQQFVELLDLMIFMISFLGWCWNFRILGWEMVFKVEMLLWILQISLRYAIKCAKRSNLFNLFKNIYGVQITFQTFKWNFLLNHSKTNYADCIHQVEKSSQNIKFATFLLLP